MCSDPIACPYSGFCDLTCDLCLQPDGTACAPLGADQGFYAQRTMTGAERCRGGSCAVGAPPVFLCDYSSPTPQPGCMMPDSDPPIFYQGCLNDHYGAGSGMSPNMFNLARGVGASTGGAHDFGPEGVVQVNETDDFCIKNEKLCIKNEEFCIKNDELCRSAQKETRLPHAGRSA